MTKTNETDEVTKQTPHTTVPASAPDKMITARVNVNTRGLLAGEVGIFAADDETELAIANGYLTEV